MGTAMMGTETVGRAAADVPADDPANPPEPVRDRWQPLRAGLVDIFYYDAEEFRFHDGRLLLRGNNGTGKSKVLALTLPFLLDGELGPSRVEPDGDRNKRMEWNLLLGGKHPHDERTGYAWLEFGRRAADGTRHYRTLGCGLKAVKGRGIAKHWFFVTPERIGPGFALMSPTRVPLTRERLKDALEGRGHVYDTAGDYRRAVDEALFGLGQERYEALVGLLIQLRQPQLSKRPDERLLSHALTEALPPLDPALVDEVAEAFRGLDEERDALKALTEASSAAAAFLGHYRGYARVAAKRQAAVLRLAHSKYEHLGRDLGEADAAHETAQEQLGDAARRLEHLDGERVRLSAAHDALNRSPEMNAARELEQAGLTAATLARVAADRASAAGAARTQATGWARRAAEAAARAQADAGTLESVRTAAAQSAAEAGIDHPAVARALAEDRPPYPETRRAGDREVDRRTRAITGLESLLSAAGQAHERARAARAEAERAAAELASGCERAADAATAVDDCGAGLAAAHRAWLDGLAELRVSDPDETVARLEAWTDTLEGPNPAAAEVADAHGRASAALTRRATELDARSAICIAERDALDEEAARLEAGGHDAPPAAHTRDQAARRGRPGAPLWRVIDFDDRVEPAERAGIESALEASGLLDAWLTPDGALLEPGTGDAVVLPGSPAPGGGLTAALRPAVDRADPQAAQLPDDAVRKALAAIGLGESGHPTWVAADGNYRIGALRGAWTKESAHYIGEGSREAARRARLAELAEQRAELTERLEQIAQALTDTRARADKLAAELAAQPSDEPLRAAHYRLAAENDTVRQLTSKSEEAADKAADKYRRAEQADSEAGEYAQDTGLPADSAGLSRVRDAVGGYRTELAALLPAAAAAVRSAEQERDAAEEAERALAAQAEAETAAEEARLEAEGAEEHRRVLAETVGAGVEELYRRLAENKAAMDQRGRDEKDARAKHERALADSSRAEGRQEEIRRAIEAAVGERDQAVTALRSFAQTGLLAAALPELEEPPHDEPWAPTRAVALARQINQELDSVDDGERAWELIQQRVSTEHKVLTDALARHGHSVGMVLHDGVMVVDVLFQGRSRDVPSLAGALEQEVAQRGRLLSAKERELLENHLIGEVAGALQERIAAAEQQVLAMNQDLDERPTSTGMKLRLQWNPARDAPEGLEAVRRRLLRQSSDAWSPADRALVGEFLQARIDTDRREHTGDSWHDQLTRALDYRSWHQFAIQRKQDGQWRPASGPASGGERVLAASVPLFAAASSHYSSGSPHAPRLIALDEAFAGVDDDSRAKCLGLLASFDLDVVMTSEREWACYPTVPGIGIAQLSRREGIDAVLVTPWRWDGRERVRLRRPEPYVPEPRGDDRHGDAQPAAETLFD
jgi:uncharacterized protein (TIGR02680 family)